MTYTALTIGPLYQTFSLAKKTREIWAGSFMFSLLMQNIIDKIESKENIILPYAKDADYPKLEAVGLYSDRLLYKGKISNLDTIITDAIDSLAGYMYKGSNSDNVNETQKARMKEILSSYVQVYYFSSDKIEDIKIEDKKDINSDTESNYIERLNTVLDSLELESKIASAASIKGISNFYKYLPDTKIYDEHYSEYYTDGTKSLVEIATHELSCEPLYQDAYKELRKDYIIDKKEEDDDVFLNELRKGIDAIIKEEKEAKKPTDKLPVFKNYHKYIAVIYGDGDKISKLIKTIVKDKEDDLSGIHTVSSTLFDWARESAETIKNYGGLPVYIGGDDILCFAPIVNGKDNIIDILKKISEDFTDKFREFPVENFPTLSFGVSVTYYKFPLNEALNQAHHLIVEMKKKGGNGINIKMFKHSGSDFHFTLKLPNPKTYEEYTDFRIFKNLMEVDFDDKMLSSTAYHMQNNELLLNTINIGDISNVSKRNERIHNFFYNAMDGYPKDKDKDKNFFKEVEKMVKHIYRDGIDEKELEEGKVEDKILPLYDMLRLVRFFKGLDKIF